MEKLFIVAVIAAAIPVPLSIVVRATLMSRRDPVLRTLGWLIFVGVTVLWIAFLLPSLNNERGWQSPVTKGLVAGTVAGAGFGLTIMIMAEVRAARLNSSRGFPVEVMKKEETSGDDSARPLGYSHEKPLLAERSAPTLGPDAGEN